MKNNSNIIIFFLIDTYIFFYINVSNCQDEFNNLIYYDFVMNLNSRIIKSIADILLFYLIHY